MTVILVGFIHVTHRHRALILEKVIFAWENAVELGKVLTTEKKCSHAAEELAVMSKFFHFEGWLIDVEIIIMSLTDSSGSRSGAGSVLSSVS